MIEVYEGCFNFYLINQIDCALQSCFKPLYISENRDFVSKFSEGIEDTTL